jgi:Polysaccharide pyruvyl transferase
MTRTLLAGWFSVAGGEATAGDLLAMEVVRDELTAAGQAVDVATNAGFDGGVDWQTVDPAAYTHLVMVCGPLHGSRLAALVDLFPHAVRISVNSSIVDPELAARFDVVIPRDGPDPAGDAPDLTLARRPPVLPVIGVVRAHAQPEYGGAGHERAYAALQLLLASRPCATVDFDTRVHPGADPFAAHARSAAAVTSVAARMDAVVTTRLHGLVLTLGMGTPALAVDPIPGGAKVSRQAAILDWPAVFTVDDLEAEKLAEALTWCLTDKARARAHAVAGEAAGALADVLGRLRAAVGGAGPAVDADRTG